MVYFPRFLTLWGHFTSARKQGDGDSLILYIKLISFAHEQRSAHVFECFPWKNSMNIICIFAYKRMFEKYWNTINLLLQIWNCTKHSWNIYRKPLWYNKIYTINISFNFQYNKRIHRTTYIIKNVIKYYKKEKKEKRLTKKNFQFHDRRTLLFLKSRGMCQKLSTFG